MSPAERILSRVEYELNTGCWLWPGAASRYGQIGIGHQKHRQVHVVMFEATVRPLSPGECVLHRCDTPLCCNPAHLFGGSQADNMADCARKGRNPMQAHPERSSLRNVRREVRGVEHHLAKLTPESAAAIRAEYRPGASKYRPEGGLRWLARKYGVNDRTIMRVVRGETWVQAALRPTSTRTEGEKP